MHKIRLQVPACFFIILVSAMFLKRTSFKNHIKRSTTTKSVITEHKGCITIINLIGMILKSWTLNEYYNKKLMSEIIHIKRQTNGINLKTDKRNLRQDIIDINPYLSNMDLMTEWFLFVQISLNLSVIINYTAFYYFSKWSTNIYSRKLKIYWWIFRDFF